MATIATRAEYQAFIGKAASITDAELGLLSMLRPMVERAVKQYLGFNVVQATYTDELYPFENRLPDRDQFIEVVGSKAIISGSRSANNTLQLKELPVNSITSIYEDVDARAGQASGAFAAATQLTEGTDFYLDVDTDSGLSWSGHVIRVGAGWPVEARTVKVTYVAGLTAAQLSDTYSDIKLACLYAMSKTFGEVIDQQDTAGLGSGAIKSRTLGETTVVFAESNAALKSMAIDLPNTAKRLLDKYVNYGRTFGF